jgi:hypothetical protein
MMKGIFKMGLFNQSVIKLNKPIIKAHKLGFLSLIIPYYEPELNEAHNDAKYSSKSKIFELYLTTN